MVPSKKVFMLVFLMVILLGSPVVNVMGQSTDGGDFAYPNGCVSDKDCDKSCKCPPGGIGNKCDGGFCVCGCSIASNNGH
nr:hypothetical protein Iba_scaffold658759CG0010 [Ipomoea batatas]GMC79633.1 hypothetical protein Iba_chr04aCG12700 [Ipomoea batatas]GMC82186.1 hypothetical protein Iba_chr04bCG11040 [Ipomoea batatas]GMC89018.1 hypothetical protein Iba_chr04eCG15530 [Ipomoea batatas]GMC90467.1 hypothetical protein Iba_chr04fCG8370 [Ipomoea batatas]